MQNIRYRGAVKLSELHNIQADCRVELHHDYGYHYLLVAFSFIVKNYPQGKNMLEYNFTRESKKYYYKRPEARFFNILGTNL